MSLLRALNGFAHFSSGSLQSGPLFALCASYQAGLQGTLQRNASKLLNPTNYIVGMSLHSSACSNGHVQALADIPDVPVDPYALVKHEVDVISDRLRSSIVSTVPALRTAAAYFFQPGVQGKRLRPTLVMLMASALSGGPPIASELEVDLRPPSEYAPELRRRQQRIAEITELIHVASLLHDDVIDDATTRRGITSLNATVGNKTAILAGDFLLARASVSLAALRDTRIVELLSQVLEHLVTGEIMQMTASDVQLLDMDHYLQKSYCKTASLMANSCRAIACLADYPVEVCDLAWNYGRHLGLAFQIVDDILDLTASSSMLGKPSLNDLHSGLATAPILFAAQEAKELQPMVLRRFKQHGDAARAVKLLEGTHGLQRARELAAYHAGMAANMVNSLPPGSDLYSLQCKEALLNITRTVLTRAK